MRACDLAAIATLGAVLGWVIELAQWKEGTTMKRIICTALVAAVGVALLAGKDDIRRFRQMRRV